MTTQACLPTSTPTESRLVARGVEIAGSGGSRVSWADPVQSLLREPNQNHATLAVVGSHGHNHVTDALSWVVGELLHDGPPLGARCAIPGEVQTEVRRHHSYRGRRPVRGAHGRELGCSGGR
jgi:hypothetical protein